MAETLAGLVREQLDSLHKSVDLLRQEVELYLLRQNKPVSEGRHYNEDISRPKNR